MPLKQEVIRYLDQLSPEAEACGAVNTVCFRNGHTVGYNTRRNASRRLMSLMCTSTAGTRTASRAS